MKNCETFYLLHLEPKEVMQSIIILKFASLFGFRMKIAINGRFYCFYTRS